jgi:hypothetical protein
VARSLEVYPKSPIDAATWSPVLKVHEPATGLGNRFDHTFPAGVTATTPLLLLKLVIWLDVDDTDTFQDVDDAFFVDDIQPGGGTLTVWEDWQATAEGIISGLTPGYTQNDFWAAWTEGDSQAMRNSVQRALTTGPGGIGRGWTITGFHQHRGLLPNLDG